MPEIPKYKPIPITTMKDFADNVSELVKEKYYSLLNRLEEKISTKKAHGNTDGPAIDEDLELTSQNKLRSVYAGIIQSDSMDPEATKLVCVTTGTKCIDGEYMSLEGLSINDWYTFF